MAAGNTVIVIEHNMDVIKTADYLIDLGPEGGDDGGRVVGCGTQEEIAELTVSYTGQFLKKILKPRKPTLPTEAHRPQSESRKKA